MSIVREVSDLRGRLHLCLLSSCFLLLFCFMGTIPHTPESQANELVNLTLHDEVYTFIKRLTAKNLIKKRLDTTQPIARREIAEALIEASEKHQLGQVELTDIEEKHLRYYQWLFGDEIETLRPGFLAPTKRKHTITLKGKDYKGDFDFKAKQEVAHVKPDSGDQQSKSITSLDFILRAKLGEQVGVSSILHDRLLAGSADYNPYRTEGSAKFMAGESRTINSMEGYIVLGLPWIRIQWGIDEDWWGPGWRGALMLSDNSAPRDNLKISGLYGPIKFTYFTAILRENTPEYQPRYMSAHRLEFLPYRGIKIGLSEVMMFADRYELRYLNPFTVFYMSQPDDLRSNGLLGVDFDITLLPAIELYGELMVDDLQTAEGLDILRVWNSKYGILAGGYWADPLGFKDTDIRIEYAFVNQYAYTHKYDITRYTYRGFVIGHWIGTDADDLWFDIEHWFTDKLRASLTYERERQGEGDVEKNHPLDHSPRPPKTEDIDAPEYWEFLSGIVESTHSLSMGISYTSIGRYSAGVEYTYSQIRNVNHNPGADGEEHRLVMKAEYRF